MQFLDRAAHSFFNGLFWGAGLLIAYVIYGALGTAFWYFVATTAMDYSDSGGKYNNYEDKGIYLYVPDFSEDFAFRPGDEWLTPDMLRDSLRGGPKLEDFYAD